MKKSLLFLLFYFLISTIKSQTTDLSIVVEAQNLTGNPISQISINQEFQYIVTIINGGNAVNNASFSQTLNSELTILSAQSQNQTGSASAVDPINISGTVIDGTIASMPSNSSVQIKVIVKAPLTPGGIATNATVFAPDGTTDNENSNNQSIISIDIVDVPIDFTVDYNQINPALGTGISAWNETVTYQLTITNNSNIDFPINNFSQIFNLDSNILYGRPRIELESISCIGGTNGLTCPTTLNVIDNSIQIVSSTSVMLTVDQSINFPSGSSLTFEIEINFLDPLCGTDLQQISVSSYSEIFLNHENESSNSSVAINTPLLYSFACPEADLCISSTQISPNPTQTVNWGEIVTFNTTVCNSGPDDVYMRFFLQNLSVNLIWDLISITCTNTSGNITCTDFTLTNQDQFWESNVFLLPANTTIDLETEFLYLESDDCTQTIENNSLGHVRSGVNLIETFVVDPNISNNAESDFVLLPPLDVCQAEDYVNLSITKSQISPVLPEGSTQDNTTSWGEVTYLITASNTSDQDAPVQIIDFMPNGENINTEASLVSVNCISTTGNATCISIPNANIDVVLDGLPDGSTPDIFWEITPEDNYILPAQSSVTFEVVVNWMPQCAPVFIKATNSVSINNLDNVLDNNESDNIATVNTYFATCVDLIVQTYPEYTSVGVDNGFNWIVDITNSNTSSNAVNIDFTNILGNQFTISGSPTCNIISGNSSCINSFNIVGNTITGNIASIDSGANIQIIIPVNSPGFGGAFTNTAQAIPNGNDNEELTPETNISISNVQVLAPTLDKMFSPNQITEGEHSNLIFTISNLSGNPEQNNIDFIDNLPLGVTISGPINWVDSNGCTATFNSVIGGNSVEVTNLHFPNGVSNCSFSVEVTSVIPGFYENNNSNFSDQNNIDSSLALATLTVIEDTSNVDIEILKTVIPEETAINSIVAYTIKATNIGSTTATNIQVEDVLPSGLMFVNASTSLGVFDNPTMTWHINTLQPNQSEELVIEAQVISTNNLLNTAVLNHVDQVDRDLTNNEDNAELQVNNCLKIPNGFSPNLDTLNDTFIIPCIEDYPNNELKIYNRYGTLVYNKTNYHNQWDGKPNTGLFNQNKVLPVGTYFYIFRINSNPTPLVGYIYLNY